MTQDDTITPFIDLVKQWSDDWHKAKDNDFDLVLYVALQATRWGADQELEACSQWIHGWYGNGSREVVGNLYAARRPKPPTLKEQALALLDKNKTRFAVAEEDVIRLALESLPD